MQETVKKRAWVKDAAIVFLAVMLVLTFFSRTILNRSLPEVSSAYVESGSIDSKVRVSGTVTAKENYEVIIEQSRKVETVYVRVGQEVAPGDVLFLLEEGDSEELEAARSNLRTLELNYQRTQLNAESGDYSAEQRDITLAEDALARAQTKYENNQLSASELAELENNLTAAKKSYNEATIGVENSTAASGGDWGGATSAQYQRVTDAKNALSAAKLAYGTDYTALEDEAKTRIAADYSDPPQPFSSLPESVRASLAYYMEMGAAALPETDPKRVAYEAVSAAEKELAEAEAAVESANSGGYYEPGTNYAGKNHSQWLKLQSEAKVKLDEYQAKKDAYDSALKELREAESTLRTAQDALTAAQKANSLTALDLAQLRIEIEDAQKKVDKLESGDASTEVKAKVAGKVESINVSAGRTANADTPLLTIEVPDRGYTLAATLSNDQARLLHVGDTAEINNFYYGGATTVELTNMTPDPKNPQSSKLCTFEIHGNVTAGNTLNFSIGERNANYDYVVPRSAVRSDSNGSFVLVLTSKSSPLGNRYYATRVEVEELARDERSCAISGAVNNMDSVITNSLLKGQAVMINNGDQVRLPDVN